MTPVIARATTEPLIALMMPLIRLIRHAPPAMEAVRKTEHLVPTQEHRNEMKVEKNRSD